MAVGSSCAILHFDLRKKGLTGSDVNNGVNSYNNPIGYVVFFWLMDDLICII